MISVSLSRRLALLAALASSVVIASCGGSDDGDGGGLSTIRALNLSSDLPSIDLFRGDTRQFSALTTNALSANANVDANTYTLNIKRAGDGATLLTGSYALSKDQHYTAVVWGRETALRLSTLPEDENTDNIATGNSRIRIFNATIDSGTVDVFLTSATANLADTAATQASVTPGLLAGFREISRGTYRLRVTGEKNPNDVRLDIPAVTLDEKKYTTLVLTAGAGGVLLNGTLLAQQGSATTLANTKARIRVAAGVSAAGNVGATVAGASVSGSIGSPGVGAYALVDAGTAPLVVRVNGSPVSTQSFNFAVGGDYTVLAYGPPATASVAVLSDDNRLPGTVSRAKVRIVNGSEGLDPITLSLDFQPLQPSDIALGTASTYYAADSSTASRIEISSPTSTDALFVITGTTTAPLLQSQAVYTVFMLGGRAAPTGVFRKDR